MVNDPNFSVVSRRSLLVGGVGVLGSTAFSGVVSFPAFAEDMPAIGTWPDGSKGDNVTIGATVPRTGAYAVQGEDELKGVQLAIEHINNGNDLIKKIAPKLTKGLLGKEIKLLVADSAAKPNEAVQEQQTFINDNKIIASANASMGRQPRTRSALCW
jgi:ABC-type branched-subunit amino acid transport system substrate-binding protein